MMDVVYFIIFLGGLIFFHELGHFLLAKLVGVRVTKFSIGFGPRVIGFRYKETDYCISMLPLGGYVKFLGDDPDNPLPKGQERQGFLTTDIWRKFLIVVAGPLFNLVLPFFIFFPMFLGDTTVPPPIIGTIAKGGPADKGGLKTGDRVLEIDGEKIDDWVTLTHIVSSNPQKPLSFRVQRGKEIIETVVTPRLVEIATLKDVGIVETTGRIEVALERSLPLCYVKRFSEAEHRGILPFDAILAIDGAEVFDWHEILEKLKVVYERPIRLKLATTTESGGIVGEPIEVDLGPLPVGEDLGLIDAEFLIESVNEGSPAWRAGIRPMDRILAMDGVTHSDWSFMLQEMARDPAKEREFMIDRMGEVIRVTVSLKNQNWVPGSALPKYEKFGAKVRSVSIMPPPVENRHLLRYALRKTWEKTRDIFIITIAGFGGIITGKVSVKEMGGPIMMYEIASTGAKIGAEEFLHRLALVSVGLGVLNLLPIPILDGGHIMIFIYEAIRRKPIGKTARQIISYIGLIFLGVLMVLVFSNDIIRKWGM